MASAFSHRLLLVSLLLFLGLVAIGVNARPGHFHPCKTLFITSFTISSIKPTRFDSPLLNPNFAIPEIDQNPSDFFAVFTEINGFDFKQQPFEIFLDRRPDFESLSRSDFQFPRHPFPKNPYESSGVSSFHERTKDILSVVMALLFGAGCGALTAATMYLAWSLITNRYEFRGSEEEDDDDDSEFDDDVCTNKMGYVKIPSAAPAVSPKEVV